MKFKKVAIIGAGPSGFYAALELLKHFPGRVDLIDRLPTPFGLVRYGIAPDNQRMKSVSKVFSDLIQQFDNLRFIGHVNFGLDLSRDDLLNHYDAIIYATGAHERHRLGVPGEDLPGSFSAMDFVDWYNGNPLRTIQDFSLHYEKAAVVGGGNVALDVVRMLANDLSVTRSTDIPDEVLEKFENNAAREVYLLIRKGPVQAKFTPVELRHLSKMQGVDIFIDQDDLKLTEEEAAYLDTDQQCRTNYGILQSIAKRPPAGHDKKIIIKFWRSVGSIGGTACVQALELRDNRESAEKSSSSGSRKVPERISVDAIFSAIGNAVGRIPDVPFDQNKTIIPNVEGQIVDAAGRLLAREFVTGWAKRGPSGTVGTNRQDSAETVATLLKRWEAGDHQSAAASQRADITALLEQRNIRFTTWEDWVSINDKEVAAGQSQNRPRVKVANLGEMMSHIERC